jgi:hypothetical protein
MLFDFGETYWENLDAEFHHYLDNLTELLYQFVQAPRDVIRGAEHVR